MRKLLLFAAAMLLSWTAFSQAIAFFDNFESYTAGQKLAQQSDYWTTWSNLPGSAEDGMVSADFALSGVNSVKISGTNDQLLVIGDKVSGKWRVTINMYIPAGFGGYYNLQKFSSPGDEWGVQAFFGEDGNGTIDAGGEGAGVFTFAHDTWLEVVNIVDLEHDWAEVWIEGDLIIGWQWSLGTFGDPGAIQLGGLNLYAGAPTGDTPTYYFDDVKVEELLASYYFDDFESYAVGDFIAVENPTWWTTWTNSPGSAEDAQISDDFGSSPVQSVLVDGTTDLILKLGDKTSGAYEVNFDMYVESGYGGYYNIQHFQTPGIEWAYDVYFTEDGTGKLLAGSSTPITFTYPKDTWFPVVNRINIDADIAYLFVDGVLVHSWPFHYEYNGTGGTNQLGGVDFYAGAETGETPKYYFDNIDYKPIPVGLYVDDFESYDVGEYIAVVNPTWWTTWTNLPGSSEDGLIVDDQASSPVKSVVVDDDPDATDLILKLGNKTSGTYGLNWKAYVETGYVGYYNVQHFQTPGIEWAYDVYFLENGVGELYAGSNTPIMFTYPNDTWFTVENNINIDADWVTLIVDGVVVHAWPFHYEYNGTGGTNQLGGVDFYASAATGETPRMYFDDVEFLQLTGELDPIITVDPASIETTAAQGATAEETLTITNEGTADLEYEIVIFYTMPTDHPGIQLTGNTTPVKSLEYTPSTDPNGVPAPYNPPNRDYVLHYDGDNANAYSWGPNAPYTITNAAMFPVSTVQPYIGMMIESVDIFIGVGGTNFRLRIYEMGDEIGPGDLIVDQPFTQMDGSWNNVVLDNPVYINGQDIWVGYQYHQPGADLYIAGADAGPGHPLGGFLTFNDLGWSTLADYESDANWNIRANLTGTPIEQWLSVSSSSGTIIPGGSEPIAVTCDASGLDVGTYNATLRILSNDPETPQIDVPVTFTVTEGGTQVSVILDFEAQEDWSLTFDPWTAVDIDLGATYGFTDITFTHNYEPMAFIAFNPATTDPPMTDDPEIQPHGGVRFGACMATVPPPFNDDWMISPQTTLGTNSSLNMWVKSYTDQYGLEKYKILVSTTGMDPADFTVISGPTPLLAPVTWTEMNFDLSEYDGQTVYVAIQCVSQDAFVFMIDDVSIDFTVGVPEKPGDVSLAIYPNPATDHLNIVSGVKMTQVDIYNQLGQRVFSETVQNNVLNLNTQEFETGVYFVRVTTPEGVSTQKIVIK